MSDWLASIENFPAAVLQTGESYWNAATGQHNTNTFGAGSYVSAAAIEGGAGGVPGAGAIQSGFDAVVAAPRLTVAAVENFTSKYKVELIVLGVGLAALGVWAFSSHAGSAI